MTTIISQIPSLSSVSTTPRPSWLPAWAEALAGALAALLAGPSAVDPAVGFHR